MRADYENRRINPFVFPSYYSLLFTIFLLALLMPMISISSIYIRFALLVEDLFSRIVFLSFPLSSLSLPLLTLFFYINDPRKKIKKEGLEKIEKKYPELFNLIAHLSKEVGVNNPITLLKGSMDFHVEVFGNFRSIYLKISDGLCEMLFKSRKLIEPIILHELSHLKNADLQKHTISEKLFKSYIILLCVHTILFIILRPFISGIFFSFHSSWLIDLYIVPTATVYFLNGRLLKIREFYADARVALLQKTTRNLILTLQFFITKPRWQDKLLAKPTALERIRVLRDNKLLFAPKLEYGIVLGLLLGIYRVGCGVFTVSMFSEYPDLLLDIILPLTGFALFSVMFFPWHFVVAMNGLRPLFELLKFLAGLALGFLCYELYVMRLIAELVLTSMIYILVVCCLFFFMFILQFALTMVFFTSQSLSRTTKFLLIEVISLLPFLLALITLHLLFIFIITWGILAVFLLKERAFGRCPNCKTKLKDTVHIFKCPYCSYMMNEWLFE